jgi:hypothetical protein
MSRELHVEHGEPRVIRLRSDPLDETIEELRTEVSSLGAALDSLVVRFGRAEETFASLRDDLRSAGSQLDRERHRQAVLHLADLLREPIDKRKAELLARLIGALEEGKDQP